MVFLLGGCFVETDGFFLLGVVLFPHYFLQPSGTIVEQLKNREWIVARITSITERVVNSRVCCPFAYLSRPLISSSAIGSIK